MRYSFFVLLICFCMACSPESKTYTFLIGSYTEDMGWVNGVGKGVSTLTWSTPSHSGQVTPLIDSHNPSFVRKIDDEIIYVDEKDSSKIYISSRGYTDSYQTYGSYACHIGISPDSNKIAVSNYGGGVVNFYRKDRGKLINLQDFVFKGKGPHPNQDASHVHATEFHPSGKMAVTADLGTDSIYVFDMHGDNIRYNTAKSFKLPDGSGPRHMVWSAKGDRLFIALELSSQLAVYSYDGSQFMQLDILSTLPIDFKEKNSVAHIQLHPNGQDLYVSNRGHHSIAHFKVLNDQVSLVGHHACGGEIPRNFTITRDGLYLVCANQKTNNITVFSIGQDGALQQISDIKTGTPVCVFEI